MLHATIDSNSTHRSGMVPSYYGHPITSNPLPKSPLVAQHCSSKWSRSRRVLVFESHPSRVSGNVLPCAQDHVFARATSVIIRTPDEIRNTIPALLQGRPPQWTSGARHTLSDLWNPLKLPVGAHLNYPRIISISKNGVNQSYIFALSPGFCPGLKIGAI